MTSAREEKVTEDSEVRGKILIILEGEDSFENNIKVNTIENMIRNLNFYPLTVRIRMVK